MELGEKIKTLRLLSKMTQEELAKQLEVSSQAVSKWENGTCAPDIYMLPKISVVFGVTIDELFDMTIDDKLKRIENMLCSEAVISDETFNATDKCLKEFCEKDPKNGYIYSLLGRLYHHRMMSDSEKVSLYARESIRLMPCEKEAQWLLQKAEGAAITDWNVKQHQKTITFYKELVAKHPEVPRNYIDLIDNLLQDKRTAEATKVLEKYGQTEGNSKITALLYEALIAECEGKRADAESCIEKLLDRYGNEGHVLFSAAGFYADRGEYGKALKLFEESFEKNEKPRFTDELEAQAIIYEILGQYDDAINCHERILTCLAEEWGTTEGAATDRERNKIAELTLLMNDRK